MTVKGDTNRKWTSTEAFRTSYDKIFSKDIEIFPYCSICKREIIEELKDNRYCPVCNQQIVWEFGG